MFRMYGYIGIFLILLGEFLIFHRIEPFSTYLFFILLWMGYIFVVDAFVYKRTGTSRFTQKKSFLMLFVYSSLFWWFYELLNVFVQNWRYENVGEPVWLVFTIAFSTVLPAVLETSDLLFSFSFFDKIKWKMKLNSQKINWFFVIGLFSLILPFVYPTYTYPFVWLSMFFLLDPLNYLNKRKSIFGELGKGKPKILLTLMFGSLICGFFWEFWNYWAPAKWFYDIPFLGIWKIFEMPLLGYFGYIPFGLSLFALYQFTLGLAKNK